MNHGAIIVVDLADWLVITCLIANFVGLQLLLRVARRARRESETARQRWNLASQIAAELVKNEIRTSESSAVATAMPATDEAS